MGTNGRERTRWAAGSGRAFTLIELLVVIGIIGIMAGLLLPVIGRVRESGRQTRCKGQLRQVGMCLQLYTDSYQVMAPFISAAYPEFLTTGEVLICPTDQFHGKEGSKPPWDPGSQFKETDELPANKTGEASYDRDYNIDFRGTLIKPWKLRNQAITACSYIYEYSEAWCSFSAGMCPDTNGGNGDGVVTWREFKQAVDERGMDETTCAIYADEAYGSHVPLLRCFYHTNNRQYDTRSTVLNLSIGHTIYNCDPTTDGWRIVK